jgi:chaperonin cofactor prefoldin
VVLMEACVMAAKEWEQMSVDEKLDHLYRVGNLSVERGNKAFDNLEYRLSLLEKHVSALTIAVEDLLEKSP